MANRLCSILLLAFAASACGHTKIARGELERRGCTDITLRRAADEYDYTASCGGAACSGTMTVHGTRLKHTIESEDSCTTGPRPGP